MGPIILAHVYAVLDQPNSAIKTLESAPGKEDPIVLAARARLEEARGDSEASNKLYESILKQDPFNREALCVLASSSYYAADPVRSFVLYRLISSLQNIYFLISKKTCTTIWNRLCCHVQQYCLGSICHWPSRFSLSMFSIWSTSFRGRRGG